MPQLDRESRSQSTYSIGMEEKPTTPNTNPKTVSSITQKLISSDQLGRFEENTPPMSEEELNHALKTISPRLQEELMDVRHKKINLENEYRILWTAGTQLSENFRRDGGLNTLKAAILFFRRATELIPVETQNHGVLLFELANALLTYYKQTGSMVVLDEAIELYRGALELQPQGHPNHDTMLGSLSVALTTRHEYTGNIDVLDEAIQLSRKALELQLQGHPNYHTSLHNLSSMLKMRYDQTKNIHALDEAIRLCRNVLELRHRDDSDRGGSLINLSNILLAQHDQTGSMDVLDEAIRLYREALKLYPQSHPDRGTSLGNLATALYKYYEQTESADALDEAICLHRERFQLLLRGHPDRGSSLSGLSNALFAHYNRTGNVDTLEEAIQLHRRALELHPQGHPNRDDSLNNLSRALSGHYAQTGNLSSLNEAIRLYREALELRPQGHPRHDTSLNNLSNAFVERCRRTGNMDELDEAIQLYRKALELRPQNHPRRSTSLVDLSDALLGDYSRTGNVDKLDEATRLLHEALELHPRDHPGRAIALKYAASCHLARFAHNADEEELINSLKFEQELLDVRPMNHPERYMAHYSIARLYFTNTSHFSWTKALEHLNQATHDDNALPRRRLRRAIPALRLLERASTLNPNEYLYSQPALDAYISVIQLLPRSAHVGLDLSNRLYELSGSELLCRTAAMRAMLLNQLSTAVEVYEEGKAVFWLQALRLRSSELDALPTDDREKLAHLFRLLEQDSGEFSGRAEGKAETESQISYRWRLGKEADDLIEKIRLRPGFDCFLKVPKYHQLSQAATNGFVVSLIANEPHFFAIIIRPDSTLKSIVLQSIDGNKLRALCTQVTNAGMRDRTHAMESKDQDINRGLKIKHVSERSSLEKMWHSIVEPIILSLGLNKAPGRQRPRMHWCPSGDFTLLPLHAAGIYEGNNQVCAADFIVSSYTPSISALIKSRRGFVPIPRYTLQTLVFGESNASGLAPIPEVNDEIKVIAHIVKSALATIMNNPLDAPRVDSVLKQIPAAHILHLACHGSQDPDPLESRFALNDGPLTISALMKLDLPSAMLAFLSACETAKGDKKQPDQAVHLAASMLFCGFRSIVATMWSMHDQDGPRIAKWFYEALLENETIDLDDIPYALDDAVQKLRQAGAPVGRWATYMHLGA